MQAYLLDLGIMEYKPAFLIQETLFKALLEKRLPAVVILQENPPVFTIGRAGSRSSLLSSEDELERRGIDVLEVNRGGDITYHGPGQLIVSFLVYLGDLDLNANQYLHRLEDVILALLEEYGIAAHKDPDNPGAWVNAAKIGAVGLAVKNGYTLHGLSINVDLDLSPFQMINPCGIPQMPVTSMAQELGHPVSVPEVKASLASAFRQVFSLEWQPVHLEQILSLAGEETIIF